MSYKGSKNQFEKKTKNEKLKNSTRFIFITNLTAEIKIRQKDLMISKRHD